jgi:hypothetical protein
VIYPNLQIFHQIYTHYMRDDLLREWQKDNMNTHKQLITRIILIVTFYETINSVKHHLAEVDIDVERHIDNGSLIIVECFCVWLC